MKDEAAIIVGGFINGFGIFRSLKKIGFDGDIYVIENSNTKKSLLKVCAKEVREIRRDFNTMEEFVYIINSIEAQRKSFFFTSENGMLFLQEAINKELLNDIISYYPSQNCKLDILIDKWKFYNFVKENNLGNIPKNLNYNENPFDIFGNKFIVRPKKSWVNGKKTPRVTIVKNEMELKTIINEYKINNISTEEICYQEVLSTDPLLNLSVMGWFENEESKLYVNRKIVRHPINTGSCDIVELIDDYPQEIIEQTKRILSALNYVGPFEMEFLYDEIEHQYKVIDVNPRFWMQHELIESRMGYYMIKRITSNEKNISKKKTYKYWINSNQLILNFLKGRWKDLQYVKDAILSPGIINSIKWIIYILIGKL